NPGAEVAGGLGSPWPPLEPPSGGAAFPGRTSKATPRARHRQIRLMIHLLCGLEGGIQLQGLVAAGPAVRGAAVSSGTAGPAARKYHNVIGVAHQRLPFRSD